MEIAHRIFPMQRVHLGLLSTRPSPVTYMYVVSAKITCFPSKLSPPQSYYQNSHGDTLKLAGWLIEIAHRIFLMQRVHLGLLPTRPSPVTYMYAVSAKMPCLPSNLSPSQSYYQHGYCSISEFRGVVDGERLSYFPHAPSAPGGPSNTTKTGHLYVRCE